MNKEKQSEIVYSERELRSMREDDLFQERYWKDDEHFDDTPIEKEKGQTIKSYVYGTDPKIDQVVDELKRIKAKRK